MSLTLDQKIMAIDYLVPDASRKIDGQNIIWLDDRTQPTEQEIIDAYYFIVLDNLKKEKTLEIDRIRDMYFNCGMSYDFNGTQDIVQTRLQDKLNLLGLGIQAREMKSMNITDHIFAFRALSNIEYPMTADEIITLTNLAGFYIHAIYQHSWLLKDLLLIAENEEEVNEVTWEYPAT